MQHANAEGRVLSGLVEALIGGGVLAGILAVAVLLSAAIMPNVTPQLAQMTDWTGALSAR
jgi:hypothetical protein